MNTYFKNHPIYLDKSGYIESDNKLKSDLLCRGIKINESSRILEIGCGKGSFTHFCMNLGVSDYTGIDIDDYFFETLKKDFPKYHFLKKTLEELSQDNLYNFDVIYTSHLFEHLTSNESSLLIKVIHKKLKKNGIWINYMPNADSVFNSTSMRYCDITHRQLYNHISFEQKINHSSCKFNILHLNDRPGTFLRRVIHFPFKILFQIFYLGMMQKMPQYYTSNLISILKKED